MLRTHPGWVYADQAFAQGVRSVIATGDQVAEAAIPSVRDQMFGAFVRATRLE